jgi:hypothetical protein
MGVERSKEGNLRRWCEFNGSVSAQDRSDGTKDYRKIKWRQRARLGSMRRKSDPTRRRDDIGEEKGRRRLG